MVVDENYVQKINGVKATDKVNVIFHVDYTNSVNFIRVSYLPGVFQHDEGRNKQGNYGKPQSS